LAELDENQWKLKVDRLNAVDIDYNLVPFTSVALYFSFIDDLKLRILFCAQK